MHGLQVTFETLAATRNEAALDVLLCALEDHNADTRRSALAALLERAEPRAPQLVLENWAKLQADDLRLLRPKRKWIVPAVESGLSGTSDEVAIALVAAESLQMTEVLPQLITMAESSASRALKHQATEIVIKLAEPLGAKAREDRDQATVRGPLRQRLADSVNRFSMHRNEGLVDAFLVTSNWGDGELREALGDSNQTLDLICRRLQQCEHSSVIELLAGFIRRRNVHPCVAELIQSREDTAFRDALLRKITAEPSATVLRNLQEFGMPSCLRGGESILDQVDPNHRAAVCHVYAAANKDMMVTLNVLAGSLLRGGTGVDSAAAFGLSRCDVPDAEFWMRAAIPVADGNEERINANPNARLLKRLIDLLDHSDPALVRGVRRVLAPLHADQMLGRFESLRPRSRRRLGRVVMMIDPDALQRVRDALRHPVLNHRLQAIAMADALAAVDILSDSFEHIAREDHQEARMRAAEVMGEAHGEATLDLLKEMVGLPECPVKDAALQAIQKRETAAI